MSSAIIIENLNFSYPSQNGAYDLPVLSNFNLEISKGEFFSIVGLSGCGKSSLLKIIGGLNQYNSGKILVGNNSPKKAMRGRKFGFVFQNPVLLDWRTAIGNVKLPSEVFHETISDEKAVELLNKVGLKGFEFSYPKQLSGGMQSRVAIARVLSYDPEFLLMDEPFGDLDEITKEQLHAELLKLWQETGMTIIFVTHNISEAVLLSDRVAIMSKKPSKIKKIYNIDLSRPRNSETKKNRQYYELIDHIKNDLKQEFLV